jgi:hypothetical protein
MRSENECLRDQMNTLLREIMTMIILLSSWKEGGNKHASRAKSTKLIVAKSEAQKWKLKWKERDEEIQKLTMDKETSAKELATLKSQVALILKRNDINIVS